eukprot:scaffold425_cov175-Amphora_coffeaeformis.AAC.87
MYLRISRSIAVFAALLMSLRLSPVSASGLRKPNARSLGSYVSVWESPNPDRSSSVPFPSHDVFALDDMIYVYVQENSKIKRVRWYIDGTLIQMESLAPFDLQGGSTSWANPFFMSSIGPGSHTMRVEVRYLGGTDVDEFPFTVAASDPTTTTTTTTVPPPTTTTTTTTTTVTPPTTTTTTVPPPVVTDPPVSDLRQFIYGKIDSGEKYIIVPPGTYRVTPENQSHLTFVGVHDVTIVAYGVEMICTETTRAITIYQCNNFKILGLTVDFDPLPYTQGRITRLSASNTVHDIELFDGYPTADQITGDKYEIFNSQTRQLRYGSYYEYSYTVQDSKHIQLTRAGIYQGEQVGDIIAIGSRYAPGGSIPHAIYLYKSVGAVLEDVTLWSSNMFGFFEDSCSGSQYIRCTIDRRPLESDHVARGDARIRSLHADAYHSKFAAVGPKYEDCKAYFMADDAVAINGNYDMVLSSSGTTLRVLGKDNKISVETGDPLEVISFTGERLDDANLVSVNLSTETPTQAEIDFLYGLGLHAPFKDGMRTIWTVEIDRSVNLPMGSLIAAANRIGNGFNVTGGDFGFNRSRGILVKGSHGVIANNKVRGSVMMAIKLAPEYWWLEGGSSNDVSIVGNLIEDCGDVGIEVSAQSGNFQIAPAGAHRDIRIQNNVVRNVGGASIKVTSTTGLVLSGNSVETQPTLQNCD